MIKKTPEMVNWYHPGQLLRTASDVVVSTLFGRFADPRIIEAFSFGKTESSVFKYAAEPDGHGRDFWFDFIADTGDGWDSSYGMAYLLAQPSLSPTLGGREAEALPRGDLLILGGDLVYPIPSRIGYDERFAEAFKTALPKPADQDGKSRPRMFAIPGNHDWYDGLVSFIRLFVNSPSIGGWLVPQSRSYFALQLPGNWWLLGVDLQLGVPIDVPQLDLFREVKRELGPEDKIIVCSHEPTWIYRELAGSHDPARFEENLAYLEHEILKQPVDVFIAGDIHHYRRHDDAAGRHKIVSGGGGAFLHPTHLPDVSVLSPEEEIPPGDPSSSAGSPSAFHEQACYPPKSISRRLAWRNLLFPFSNPSFGIVPAVVYLITSWVARAPVENYFASEWPSVLDKQVTTIIRDPFSSFWMMALFSAFWMFTNSSSRAFRWIGGTAHGLVHLVACLLIAWWARSVCVNSLTLESDRIPQLLFTGLIIAVLGWAVGSIIFGVYLLVSINLFGEHSNEAFSSLRIGDYKNFLRMKIDGTGRLLIYAIGVERVPRRWRKATEDDRRLGVVSEIIPIGGSDPILIERPIVVTGRGTRQPVAPASDQSPSLA